MIFDTFPPCAVDVAAMIDIPFLDMLAQRTKSAWPIAPEI